MFRNYFKTAWRNLLRNRVYSFINIAGLTIGLACAMLITLYVKDEASFDRFHANGDHIYRIVSKAKFNGEERKSSHTGYLQGPRFSQAAPGIADFVRIQSGTEEIKLGNEVQNQALLYVDSPFLRVFNFPLVAGNPASCLNNPSSVVISEDAAKKHFGTVDALGKTILVKTDSVFKAYTVSAVSKTCPQNSSIRFDMLLPFRESEADANNGENWFSFFLNTFVVLRRDAQPALVADQMQRFYEQDAGPAFKALQERYGDVGVMGNYYLQPFTDMHLNTELPAQNGLVNASNPMYGYILSGIALFVLLIACINFINLTVARSVKRAKEIGIRKVVGGSRQQLIGQFLGESFILCSIAFILAIIVTKTVLPLFNTLANKALFFSYLFDAKLVLAFIGLYFATGLLAGFYPALVLSGYNPIQTLYSRFSIGGKNYLQKSLVVLQFSLASFLIIGTLTIFYQFNYLTNQPLGYDDSNVVIIKKNRISHPEAAIFVNELKKSSNILAAAAKNGGYSFTGAKIANDSSLGFAYETVDDAYIPLLKIPLVAGRNFSAGHPSDARQSVIVNESFVKKAGWKNPIGETVNFFYNNNEIYQVIGVVKDYHFLNLNEKIGPQLFTMKPDNEYGDYIYQNKTRHPGRKPEMDSQNLPVVLPG
ncbi:MAG: ABC transporter permease [Flavihumibacter sp.]